MNRLYRFTMLNCICLLLCGCLGKSTPALGPTTGGSIPVDKSRLTNVKLVDIREPLSWEFDESKVKIDFAGKPIPEDVVTEVLGDDSVATRIDADWILDETNNQLKLENITVDGTSRARSATLPIMPAGQVRVDLGGRQYNLFRKDQSSGN